MTSHREITATLKDCVHNLKPEKKSLILFGVFTIISLTMSIFIIFLLIYTSDSYLSNPDYILTKSENNILYMLSTLAAIQATIFGIFISVNFLVFQFHIYMVPPNLIRHWFLNNKFIFICALNILSIFSNLIILKNVREGETNSISLLIPLIFSASSIIILLPYIYISTQDLIRKIVLEEIRNNRPRKNLEGFDFRNENISLKKMNMDNMILNDACFEGCNLFGTEIKNTKLNNAKFSKANLINCKIINSNLVGSKFEDSKMTQIVFANSDLTHALLFGADMKGATFKDCTLRYAVISTAELTGARLYGTDFEGASFWKADLRRCQFIEGAILINADLQSSDLEGADLTSALLQGANFRKANLRGTIFGGNHTDEKALKSLFEATNLNEAYLDDNLKSDLRDFEIKK